MNMKAKPFKKIVITIIAKVPVDFELVNTHALQHENILGSIGVSKTDPALEDGHITDLAITSVLE